MTEKENNQVPTVFNLQMDLKYFHGDTKHFTRNEALRMIVMKFQILKDFILIKEYLESVIRYQAEKYFLIDREQPAESLAEFFSDLKLEAQKLPHYEIVEWSEWRNSLFKTLKSLHNSAHFFAHGSYWGASHQNEANEHVQHYISLLSGKDEIKQKQLSSGRTEIKEINPVFYKIPEVAKILNCCKDTVYKKHINILGLKTVKVEGDFMKVAKEDLEEHIERIRTNSVAKKQP